MNDITIYLLNERDRMMCKSPVGIGILEVINIIILQTPTYILHEYYNNLTAVIIIL